MTLTPLNEGGKGRDLDDVVNPISYAVKTDEEMWVHFYQIRMSLHMKQMKIAQFVNEVLFHPSDGEKVSQPICEAWLK